jgi:restriction system protein
MTLWMVRAGINGAYAETFLEKGIVGMGWVEIGSIEKVKTRDDIIAMMSVKYPHKKSQWIKLSSSQLFKFRHVMEIGDRVLTCQTIDRFYNIGTIISNYEYNRDVMLETPNIRQVKWEDGKIYKDDLSIITRHKLGTMTTLFKVTDPGMAEIENYKRK